MSSALEEHFLLQLRANAIPLPLREYHFCEGAAWKFDFAWPNHFDFRLAVECEGGTYSGGRHTRGKGYEQDCTKYNFAVLLGWTVIRVTRGMVDSGEAVLMVKVALGWENVNELIERRRVEIAHRRSQGARLGHEIRKQKEGRS